MNKIFKIVFNAARGKMMVVNEATSSVQTGKKAAVTVAVIGALVSGVAMAGSDFAAQGVEATITTSENAGQKLMGGWKHKGTTVTGTVDESTANTKLTVDVDATFDDLIGGDELRQSNKTDFVDYKLGSTQLTINNATTTDFIVGGSKATTAFGTIETGSTSLNIQGGKFQNQTKNARYYYEIQQVVVAGDSLKMADGAGGNGFDCSSTIENTNLTISGGTFDTMVVGGSFAYNHWYYEDNRNAKLKSFIDTATTTITGGTFNMPVFGASVAINGEGGQSVANVDHVVMDIVGNENGTAPTFNAAIYAGGLVASDGTNQTVEVKDATVTMTNAKVKDFYGATAKITDIEAANKGVVKGFEGTNTVDSYFDVHQDIATNLKVVNSTVSGKLDVANGTVELRAEGEGTTSVGTLSVGDKVSVALTADGKANDAAGGDIEKLISIDASYDDLKATVVMEEGQVMGAVNGTLEGDEFTGTVAVNSKTLAVAEQVNVAPFMITRILMNDVRKRMGDLRAAEGTHGAWARYNGGQMSGSGLEADFHMVQVGVDTVPVADAPRFGVAFSYAQTESEDVGGLSSTDMDSFSLAFYGTKMYDNGMFVDVIGRMATMDTEMNVVGNKAKMDNVALSLSGELGWRFDVTDKFFFEPSVEATYTYTNADTFTMGSGKYELEAVDSLVGRAGFAAGFKCPANKGDVYVRAAVVHEFMGDSTMRSWAGDREALPVEMDGKDTWFEYAIGANFNVNKNTYVYADVERTSGGSVDEDWRANVGVRYAF